MTAATHPVKPTWKLGAIIDFVASGPGGQTRVVEQIHRMYTDEAARPWFYYDAMLHGIKRAMVSPDPYVVLQEVVDDVADETKAAHYRELQVGATRWIRKNRPALVPVGSADWTDDVNVVNVKPQLGLRVGRSDWAVALYLKKAPLTQAAANSPLWMIERECPAILPGGHAAILDVRRGRMFKLRSNSAPKRLDASVAGTVASFAAIWNAIA